MAATDRPVPDRGGFEVYLHDNIPLTAAMEVSVEVAAPDRVVLAAPLAPNVNHRDTGFGGSTSALAILAGWSLVHLRLRELRIDGRDQSSRRLVIQRNQMEYLLPVEDDFVAECRQPDAGDWQHFARMLERRDVGRVTVQATVRCRGETCGRFEGDYVALASPPSGDPVSGGA